MKKPETTHEGGPGRDGNADEPVSLCGDASGTLPAELS